MSPRTVAYVAAISCGLQLFSGCASPVQRLYTLAPPIRVAATAPSARLILVGPIGVPPEMDRPQIVLRDGPYRVIVSEQDRWAVSIKDALAPLLAEQLNLDGNSYRFLPALSSSGDPVAGRLRVDFLRIDLLRNSAALISVHWSFHSEVADDLSMSGDAVETVPVSGPGYDAMLDALRAACANLSSAIVSQLPAAQR